MTEIYTGYTGQKEIESMNIILYGFFTAIIAALLYIWFKVMDRYGGNNS